MASSEDRLAALEREVALQRDHLEVRQLIASYGPLVATSDRLERSRMLAELWVEDGVYDIGGVGERKGQEEIARAFEERHFAQVQEGVGHVMVLQQVQVDGECATEIKYFYVYWLDGSVR